MTDGEALAPARPTRVFISYANDSAEHADAVRSLWLLLRASGVDAKLDLPAAEERQDWPEWMRLQIRDADFVLVIASPEYRRRAENEAPAGEGRGVQFEAALLRHEVYRDRAAAFKRFLPVLLPGQSVDGIPTFLVHPLDRRRPSELPAASARPPASSGRRDAPGTAACGTGQLR